MFIHGLTTSAVSLYFTILQQKPLNASAGTCQQNLQQYLNTNFFKTLQSSPNLEVDMVNSKILDRSSKSQIRRLRMNFSSKESS